MNQKINNAILLRNRQLTPIESIRSNLTDITHLLNFSAWRVRWDYCGCGNNANFYGSQIDWNQTLQVKMNEISSQIHKSTLRGGANHVFINPKLLGLVDTMQHFIIDDMTIGSRYKVVLDDRVPENKIIMSYVMKSICDKPLKDNGDGTVTFSLDYEYDNNRLNGVIQIDNLDVNDIMMKPTEVVTQKCLDEIVIVPRKLLLIRN